MSKYIEGEWLLADNDKRFIYALNPQGYNSFYAHVHGPHTSTEELEATARLMRASKDLLEALKYARRFLRPYDHDVTFVDAAIAKATGEQS